ncbi:hypothetical protein ACQKE0_04325 [Shewanella colwelliana]|uniref:hypothetical protein n=1 Tax=Shewanella colwelliana TaxID=23 RepID=UPI003CFEB9C5
MAVQKKKTINSTKKAISKKTKGKQIEASEQFKPKRFLTSGSEQVMTDMQLDICTDKVNTSTKNLKLTLLAIYVSKGWKAGGYISFKDYVESSLNITYDAALKQAIAAEIAYRSIGINAVGKFSDASMLAMKGFTDVAQKKIVKHLRKKSPRDPIKDHSLTASQVEKAIQDLYPSTSNENKQKKEAVKDLERLNKLKKFESELKSQSDDITVAEALITAFAKTQTDRNIEEAIKLLSSYLEEKEA